MSAADQVNLFNRYESNTIFKRASGDASLPVTLIVGQLGSGKTSTVQRLLANRGNLRIAVAVNDFAKLNVDSLLITRHDASQKTPVTALSGGCSCCSLMGALRDTVAATLESLDVNAVDCLLLETSGVSDPWPIISALDERFGKLYRARLDQVVAVVDASVAVLEAAQPSAMLRSQLEAADLVVVNKTDLVSAADRATVEALVRRVNPTARLLSTSFGDVPLPQLLDVVVVDASDGASGVLSHEQTVPTRRFLASLKGGALRAAQRQRSTTLSAAEHDTQQLLDAFSCDDLDTLSLERFQDFVRALPPAVVRGKGTVLFACDGSPRVAYEFSLSGNGRHLDIDFAKNVDASAALTQLAFIARRPVGVAALEAALRRCASDASVPPAVAMSVPPRIAGDKRLAARIEAPNILIFRVSADFTGMSEAEMRAYHGITLDRINYAVLRAANALNVARSPTQRLEQALLTPVRRDNGKLWLRYALTPDNGAALLAALDDVLERTLERETSSIGCKCQY